jgi:hypothetical protein
MRSVFSALMAYVVSRFRTHESLRLENMALRHQLAVYQQTVKRPKLQPSDRLFWVWLSRLWPDWQRALEFVQPRTVIAWQKKRFRNYWRQLSHSGKMGAQPFRKKPGTSSETCGGPTRRGDHLVSWASSVSWASTWPNQQWRSTVLEPVNRLHPLGRPFSIITSRTSWHVISSSFQLPPISYPSFTRYGLSPTPSGRAAGSR